MLDNIIQLKTLDLFILVTIPKWFPQERQRTPNANVKRHHLRHINIIQPEIDALWSSHIQMEGWRAFQPLNDAPSGRNAFQAAWRLSRSEHSRRHLMLGRSSGQRLFTGVVTFPYHDVQCLEHRVHFLKKEKESECTFK